MKSPQGLVALPAAVAQQVRQEMFRSLVTLVLSDTIDGRTVKSLTDGKSAEISDGQGNRVKLEIDEQTGLPVTLTYSTTPISGSPAEVVETYTGWKNVNEVMLPFEYTIDQSGKRFAEAKVTAYRVNTGITAEELSKKP